MEILGWLWHYGLFGLLVVAGLGALRGFFPPRAFLGAIGGGNTRQMVGALIEQAGVFGSDSIVDLRTVMGGDSAYCVMTGTAVRSLPVAGGH